MPHRVGWVAAAILSFGGLSSIDAADAVPLAPGQSVTIDFTSTTATPPFDFVTLTLDFSSANPFGPNEQLKFSTFNANNAPLTSATISSGNSVYTSGLGGSLTENAIVVFNPATELTTTSFYAVVTDLTGSFDLTDAQANFEHVIYTTGTNQLGVEGAISATPLPAALPLFASGFGAIGLLSWRRKQKAAATIAA
jgi:hypothetical protein